MPLDQDRFWKAFNPSKPLNIADAEDLRYYIDFSDVRGGNVTRQLARTIERLKDSPTCQLFTGHIGCGKSTELLCLKNHLTKEGFHVVFFESSDEMDLNDVDVTDILIAIARQVSASLESINISLKPNYFVSLFKEVSEILKTPIEISNVQFSVGLASVAASTKDSPELRRQMRQIMEPRTNSILESINLELLGPAEKVLKQKGYKGLVVLIDNLDRLDNTQKAGKPQSAYLFVDRGEQLRRLNCHVVYTIPIVLVFSNEVNPLANRFGIDPQVLPMVIVRYSDERICDSGLNLLRQVILARSFPTLASSDRLAKVEEVFEDLETLDQLCLASGGHVRNLLKLGFSCLQRMDPPFSRQCVERVIRQRRNELLRAITPDEMTLLRQVKQKKTVRGEASYEVLLKSMFVFEYRSDDYGHWFDVNPILYGDL
ncbi:ATP-binding protein [Oscillatoria sp. CS-180]|uniref:ATP-binding protein n=1 Tax=Oscillatoria sp. CS-180 TaxID=3021720 RepID=UPI0023313C1E|nr:ATP-binding protein [Oscillatoria sp. CS-180]MDB9527309.1 ATP-binding protein [Oscillatoria sp. CS-180]